MMNIMYDRWCQAVGRELDMERLKRNARQIHELERSGSCRDFSKSMDACAEMLRRAGAVEVEKIALKADGKTAYMDYIMPQAWDLDDARLELPDAGLLLADLKRDRLCVANHSAPFDGVLDLVSFEDLKAGKADATGKLVFTASHDELVDVQRAGAAGLVYSNLAGVPGGTYWINGWSSPGWHHTAEDRKIFGFSLTPERGAALAKRLEQGPAQARALVKSRLYDGEVYTVTGRLAGESEEELCLLSHVYEPFLADAATGAAELVELCRTLKTLVSDGSLPPLRKSVRFIVSMERYGFAAHFGAPANAKKALWAVNMDANTHNVPGMPLYLRSSPACSPHFCDLLLKDLVDNHFPGLKYTEQPGNFSDDTFIADPQVGVPCNWFLTPSGKYHHNSAPEFDLPDWDVCALVTKTVGSCVAFLSTAKADDFVQMAGRLRRLADGDDAFMAAWRQGRLLSINRFAPGTVDGRELNVTASEPPRTAMEREADNMVIARTDAHLPFSQARIPHRERSAHNYDAELVIPWADGKRSLWDILELLRHEHGRSFSDQDISALIAFLRRVGEHGYVETRGK